MVFLPCGFSCALVAGFHRHTSEGTLGMNVESYDWGHDSSCALLAAVPTGRSHCMSGTHTSGHDLPCAAGGFGAGCNYVRTYRRTIGAPFRHEI